MRKLTVLILILAVLAGCAQKPAPTTVPTVAATEASTAEPTEAPIEAPDFTVYDRDGNPVTLSSFRGKPVVLNFWASWCGPCKAEMPDFDEAARDLEGKVAFMMVNLTDGMSETVESASAFIESSGYRFPVYYDTTMEAASAYGIQSIPTTFFINAQGQLVAYYPGTMSMDTLIYGISMITE